MAKIGIDIAEHQGNINLSALLITLISLVITIYQH